MTVTHDSILETDNLVALECSVCFHFREGEKPEHWGKTLEAQET